MNAELMRRGLIGAVLVLTLWASWWVGDEADLSPDSGLARSTPATTGSRSALAPDRPAETGAGASRTIHPLSLRPGDVTILTWPVRGETALPIGDLFALPGAAKSKTDVVEPPSAPPLGLTYVGRMDESEQSRIFFSDAAGTVSLVAAGEKFPNGWRLVSSDNGRLVFRHDTMKQEQIIPTGVFK